MLNALKQAKPIFSDRVSNNSRLYKDFWPFTNIRNQNGFPGTKAMSEYIPRRSRKDMGEALENGNKTSLVVLAAA